MSEIFSNIDNPMSYQKISPSELKSLMRCKKQHDYAYRQGLQQKDPPSYLGKGGYLHALMERWLHLHVTNPAVPEGTPPDDIQFDLLRNTVRNTLRLEGRDIQQSDAEEVDKVFRKFTDDADMGNVKIMAVEQEFYVDLGLQGMRGKTVLLHGIIDVVLREKGTGNVWISDHKTAGRRWSQGQFMMDFQTPLYGMAWEALTGEPVIGSLFNFFYPKDTEQHTFYWTEKQAATWLDEVQQAINMRDCGFTIREPHWGCNDCWFRNLCHAELIGANAEYIRETEYVVNEDKAARFQEVE